MVKEGNPLIPNPLPPRIMKFFIPAALVLAIIAAFAWKYLSPGASQAPSADTTQTDPAAKPPLPPPSFTESTASYGPGSPNIPLPGSAGSTLPVNPINGGPSTIPISPEQQAKHLAAEQAARHDDVESSVIVQNQISEVVKLDAATNYGLIAAMNEAKSLWKNARLRYTTATTMTPEDVAAMATDLKAKSAAIEQRIKSILRTEETQDQFKKFQDSAPERQTIGVLKKQFGQAGAPISEEQEQQLMDILHSERKNMKLEFDYTDMQDTRPEKFSAENLALFTEQSNAADQAVATRLEPVLSAPQREAFRLHREQQRAQEMTELEFAKALFGVEEVREEAKVEPK